jgi:hypothetical protein
MAALGENTDILDNLMRRDLAITAQTADVLAGAPVSSIVLTGQIFVGEFGVANNQATRDRLVSVLDSNDNEIITTAGVTVKALLIHDGASANVVGTQTSGFFTTPTVNLNVAIPAGVTYHVVYGERTNLATMPKDAFTSIKIRSAQEVSGETERVLRDLHAASGATWNDPWLATINSLARTGLDGRYRLASVTDPGTTMDVPGNGGFINRDGPAVRYRAPTYLLDAVGTVGVDKYPDAILAMMRLERVTPVTGTAYDLTRGGDVGFIQESPYHNTADANEVSFGHVTGPLTLDVVPRSVAASTLSGAAVLTRLSSSTVCTANPDALTDATSRRTIQVGGSDFFKDGSGRTALRSTDLIEVINNATGLVVGTYRIDSVASATRLTLKALTGANPPIGPSGSSASVRLRWLQPTVSIGGTHRAALGTLQGTPHFMVAQPGLLHSTYNSNDIVPYAAFLSSTMRRDLVTSLNLLQAMAWGGFDTDGQISYGGFLYGDGSISVARGRQRMSLHSTLEQVFTLAGGATGNVTINYNPLAGGQAVVKFTAAPSVATVLTFNLDTTLGYVATPGDEFDLFLAIPDGTVGPLSVTWFPSAGFAEDDGVVPPTNTGLGLIVLIRYTFRYSNDFAWRATRVDYEG